MKKNNTEYRARRLKSGAENTLAFQKETLRLAKGYMKQAILLEHKLWVFAVRLERSGNTKRARSARQAFVKASAMTKVVKTVYFTQKILVLENHPENG